MLRQFFQNVHPLYKYLEPSCSVHHKMQPWVTLIKPYSHPQSTHKPAKEQVQYSQRGCTTRRGSNPTAYTHPSIPGPQRQRLFTSLHLEPRLGFVVLPRALRHPRWYHEYRVQRAYPVYLIINLSLLLHWLGCPVVCCTQRPSVCCSWAVEVPFMLSVAQAREDIAGMICIRRAARTC